MELVPQTFPVLLRRMERELEQQDSIFDLPRSKFWTGEKRDLGRSFHGERAASVVGPAAGPHTQLAQNIVLSYLAGSRILELKTVQIMDELEIPRPCIDATNIGFNVEWSQELKIEQSAIEYPKAALLIAALERLGVPDGIDARRDGPFLFDLSVGYDLAGIKNERVTGFIKQMMDARAIVERLLATLPPDLASYRDLQPRTELASCVTLSTFHGCPADEIELIAKYLLEEIGVHVVVKLNPTLLGFNEVNELVRGHLGYEDLVLDPKSFEADLQWDQAMAMIGRLRAVAEKEGRHFGVKLTNTLVVNNHKDFFPKSEKQMYMSGQPLHVIASRLYAKIRKAMPLLGDGGEPPLMYSFSAGIDQKNFHLAAAADLVPVTTCTDLLRPGGYSRLPKYLSRLESEMAEVASGNMENFVLRAHSNAKQGMQDALPSIRRAIENNQIEAPANLEEKLNEMAALENISQATLRSLKLGQDVDDIVWQLWVHATGTLNAQNFADAAYEDIRYRSEKNNKAPKKIGSALELFDCVNCDKCVPVCPNDANFAYEIPPRSLEAPVWRFAADKVEVLKTETVDIEKDHQLATFVDFCNGCGNCDIFCPEDGGPYAVKPHWFAHKRSFDEEKGLDGFYAESRTRIVGRFNGESASLEVGDVWNYQDDNVDCKVLVSPDSVQLEYWSLKGDGGHDLPAGRLLIMAALLEGVQSTINPVSAQLLQLDAKGSK